MPQKKLKDDKGYGHLVPVNREKPIPPDHPCSCGSKEWWLRPEAMILGTAYSPAGWLCVQCYTPLVGENVERYTFVPKRVAQ